MEETTYLEEFLSSLEQLPNNVRRDFDIMREFDKEALDVRRELAEKEKAFVAYFEKIPAHEWQEPRLEDQARTLLEEISVLRNRARRTASKKTSITLNMMKDIEKFTRKLDSDLAFFETELRGCGDFEQLSRGVETGSDVAIKLSAASSSSDIILGRVICYHADIGMYDIADVDNSKRYHLPESQVLVLDLPDSNARKLCKGEEVLAVYPDTTSFYLADVAQVPRARTSFGTEPTVSVQFRGDADEAGLTPNRLVPLKHVVRPPALWVK